MRRVDRRSGTVKLVQYDAEGSLCGGPLNADCDPVTGIAPDPWSQGCVVAAIGLVHFAPHGRIVRVCGDRVKRVYFRPYKWDTRSQQTDNGEPFATVAFFGVCAVGKVLYAAGIDGLYEIRQDGSAHSTPLPSFEKIGPYYVNT